MDRPQKLTQCQSCKSVYRPTEYTTKQIQIWDMEIRISEDFFPYPCYSDTFQWLNVCKDNYYISPHMYKALYDFYTKEHNIIPIIWSDLILRSWGKTDNQIQTQGQNSHFQTYQSATKQHIAFLINPLRLLTWLHPPVKLCFVSGGPLTPFIRKEAGINRWGPHTTSGKEGRRAGAEGRLDKVKYFCQIYQCKTGLLLISLGDFLCFCT